MKKFLYLIVIVLIIFFSCNSQNVSNMETVSDLYVGMSVKQFQEVFPNIEIQENEKEFQTGFEEDIYGLSFKCSFNFKENKLYWILINSYSDEITEANFQKYKKAYFEFKTSFEKSFGKPMEETDHDVKFKDPYIERHWGYDVLETIWMTPKMKFKLIFTFMGGKGEYHFLLKVEFHDKNYEYF